MLKCTPYARVQKIRGVLDFGNRFAPMGVWQFERESEGLSNLTGKYFTDGNLHYHMVVSGK